MCESAQEPIQADLDQAIGWMEESARYKNAFDVWAISERNSPIERLFWHELQKRLRPSVWVCPQWEVVTDAGTFRTDFLLAESGRIAIECDGKDWHKDYCADERRDAAILRTQCVDAIYRLPGSLIWHRPEQAVAFVLHFEKWAFEMDYPRHCWRDLADRLDARPGAQSLGWFPDPEGMPDWFVEAERRTLKHGKGERQ